MRVDSHLYSGYSVPPYYDSMIAKLITWGANRETAINKMQVALSEIAVDGIKTNIALHQELLDDPIVRKGGMDIHYLEQKLGLK